MKMDNPFAAQYPVVWREIHKCSWARYRRGQKAGSQQKACAKGYYASIASLQRKQDG